MRLHLFQGIITRNDGLHLVDTDVPTDVTPEPGSSRDAGGRMDFFPPKKYVYKILGKHCKIGGPERVATSSISAAKSQRAVVALTDHAGLSLYALFKSWDLMFGL